MKYLIIFLFIFSFYSFTDNSYSQNVNLKIDLEQASLSDVFKNIENQSEFVFLFNDDVLPELNKVIGKIKFNKEPISKVLNKVLKGSNLGYVVDERQIIIKKNEIVILPDKINLKEEPQQQVTGIVKDALGIPLPGVNISVIGTKKGTQTDFDGNFQITANKGDVLHFSYIGMKTLDVTVGDSPSISVTLQDDLAALGEVVIVGYGSQKKESVVGAISTINPSELKIPSSNLTTALAGRLSGVIAFQNSGEPGADNAQFFVRGVASFNGQNGPLILIDGVELTVDDLARLQPDDIASFSVLKDPTTTAIYGARGANGIILVTTKTGIKGKPVLNVRYESSFSQPVSLIKLADPLTHMRMQNEAGRTRGDFATFTERQIDGVERGLDPNVFPQVDWYDKLFNDYALSTRFNLNVRGGGDKVRYYVAGSYSSDSGLLKNDNANGFNNNIKFNQYLLRSNINMDLHQNTEMIVRLHATIDDLRGPLQGGNAIYNAAVRTSPVRFPAVFDPTEALEGIPHIPFGNDQGPRLGSGTQTGPTWYNPYAELQRGYKDYRRQLSLVQLELKQDLSSITPGLRGRFLGNINTTSAFENRRSYIPYFYRVTEYNPVSGDYVLSPVSDGNEALQLEPGSRTNNSVFYTETALDYARTFNEKHSVTGLAVMTARDLLDGNASTVELSLPSRNLTFAGRFSYGYDDRYFVEFNFGYNGSERFAKKNRFGFFPSAGAGWVVSNEKFFKSNVISKLKFRASYGIVGNDQIGNSRQDRFFYLSNVDINNPGTGYTFGETFNTSINGVSIARYANPLVTWETSEKVNIGLDLNLFDDDIQFRADIFQDNRSSILQVRQDIPSTLGLQALLQTNIGEVRAFGVDASLDINHTFNKDFWIQGRATFVYADNEFKVFEEPDYSAIGAPWRSNIGNNTGVAQGFIAERLFVDDYEAKNSPTQFGTPGVDYGGGDIKYKDLNNDGKISDLDKAPIGKPQVPKITYGFGFSMGYKKWDFNAFFQGIGERSFFIDPISTGPFLNSTTGSTFGGNGTLGENGLLQVYADDHWSEENRDVYALYPRLSTRVVDNNVKTSTWWLRDGTFLRLKQLEVGFNLLDENSKLGLQRLRLYANGSNLAVWSKFKLWDPELGGNGLNYPLQRVINVGLQIGF
ncbi:TonB-dependent receptor [Mariniflexile litorale]|uniref:TonB-dependent receptor n=1 Tax=Mariniflexile litorale TaxID=3045158 RepID=A0AAU7EFK7_9FLAO|nr:TonB-dependent receptor [Mariniflexile sp. KMM 9835]MDQ8211620.1 TonB-dependent receptor [Mariniflexile sp. KMM 9835]